MCLTTPLRSLQGILKKQPYTKQRPSMLHGLLLCEHYRAVLNEKERLKNENELLIDSSVTSCNTVQSTGVAHTHTHLHSYKHLHMHTNTPKVIYQKSAYKCLHHENFSPQRNAMDRISLLCSKYCLWPKTLKHSLTRSNQPCSRRKCIWNRATIWQMLKMYCRMWQC